MGKMHNFRLFLASRKGQILFNVLYSWGAAVVIAGAMCKIMHFKGGDYILMAGMIVEVLVFVVAGFDYASIGSLESETNGGVIVGSGSAIGGVDSLQDISNTTSKESKVKTTGASGHVVVVAGGGNGSFGGLQQQGTSVSVGGQPAPSNVVSSGNSSVGNIAPSSSGNSINPEYAQSLSNTAQNLDDFSNTIHSLNEASQKILDAYRNVTDANGFADNLATLNQNVSGLNEVFSGQLQTISEQMAAIRYINDSLQRMKNLYDGAIGDSYMFREESAKMTKHIESLNNVYARLLQAMTTNNNSNMNQNNF